MSTWILLRLNNEKKRIIEAEERIKTLLSVCFHSIDRAVALQHSLELRLYPQLITVISILPPAPWLQAPADISKVAASRQIGSRRRTQAPSQPTPPSMPHQQKMKPLSKVMARPARGLHVVVDGSDYSQASCEQCGSGDQDDELLLSDECYTGFRMKCLRPVVVRVPIGSGQKCSGQRRVVDSRKRQRQCGSLVQQKKRRRLLLFISSEDCGQRQKQMGTLASALTALQMEFSDELTYMPGMAARSANQASGMQVLSKEDTETLEQCRTMCKRGECPPLVLVFDYCKGFTVEADCQIKHLTLIGEYKGNADYLMRHEMTIVIV